MAFDEVSSPVLAKKFSNPDFNPEEYVKSILTDCDMYRSLYNQRNNIRKLGDETAVSLKKNVYRNYRQFIDTAKEISYLEAEMYQLNHLLSEQKSVLADQLENHIFARPKGLPKKIDPQIEAYNAKKKKFIESINASKQLISQLSAKELIFDGELTEYDSESYSSVQKINAYLLSDALLITTIPTNGKSSILHFFDLSDLAVVNVRDGQGVSNAFKILYSLDSRMFSAPDRDAKLAWLDKIDHAKKNYRKGVQIDAQKLEENRRSQENQIDEEEQSSDDEIKSNEESEIQDENQNDEKTTEVLETFPNLLNVDWLIELPEDLDMRIAQRDFEGAVQLVEKGRSYLTDFPESSPLKDIRSKIECRVETLVSTLEKALDNSASIRHVSLRSIRIYVLLLIRLGRAKLACELFLQNRGYEIKNSFKQLKMEGATLIYIQKLVNVFFTAIIETGKEYKRNFPYNRNCSSFIVWVHKELEHFVNKFSHQVFTRNSQLSDISQCIKVAVTGCKRLFNIGIDLTFDLQHMFLKDLVSAMFDSRDQLLEKSKMKTMEDCWEDVELSDFPDDLQHIHKEIEELGVKAIANYVQGNTVKLSISTMIFSKGILVFLRDGINLYTTEVHDVFVQCLYEIFKAQTIQFESLLKDSSLAQYIDSVKKNIDFVYNNVFKYINSSLYELIGHEVKSMKMIKDDFQRLKSY